MEHSVRTKRPLSTRTILLILLGVVAVLSTACTTDGESSRGEPGPTPVDRPLEAADGGAHAVDGDVCVPDPNPVPVEAHELPGGRDWDLISFDGTRIRLHWLPHPDASAGDPRPTVLMGPGWSLAGATAIDDVRILGSTSTRSLREAGYNILTWDPRGFGASEGTSKVDSAEFEGRDVQRMIDWLAGRPEVRLDAEHDPRIAMVGGSYGGGIALVGAAIDCRVDVVVATAAWHSLETSLYRNETVKIGWVEVLVRAALGHSLDDHVGAAIDDALVSGVLSDDARRWFVERGPGDLIDDITVPVLLIQGTVDTLFTLDEAIENHRRLVANGVPTAMMWNCDGHGLCLTDTGDPMRATVATIAWLDRYLGEDPSVDTGPAFDTIDQDGRRFVADRYVDGVGRHLSASGSGRLELSFEGGAESIGAELSAGQMLDQIARDITPARANRAVEVTLESDREALVVGSPVIQLTYTGHPSSEGDRGGSDEPRRPARVFAQLVDETTGLVIGNQTTPVPLVVDGAEHRIEIPLETISFSLRAGSRVTLQLTASTVSYTVPLLGPTVEFDSVELRLPVADWLRVADVGSDTD